MTLFILTGQIQTGKTRWLQGVLDELDAAGTSYAGVLAPGVWREKTVYGKPVFEKLGIDNLLLPERTLIPFARRRDLALEEGTYEAESQSARANMGWEISDGAIDRVNAHFDVIEQKTRKKGPLDLLVVDELGQLELLRGEGLASAMRMLESGDTRIARNALVIVRDVLVGTALEKLSPTWNKCQVIHPTDEAFVLLTGSGL